MKVKISQISNLLLFGLIFILMSSCHQSESFDDVIKSSTSNECSYLSIDKDPMNEPLTPEEELILKEAFTRITIINDNGFRKIKQTCGAEINISEPLFEFFFTIVEKSNHNTNYQTTRTETEFNDCVARTIYYFATLFGTPESFNSINNWITQRYGVLGIELRQIDRVVRQFLTAESIDASYYISSMTANSNNKLFLVIRIYENGVLTKYHAVAYMSHGGNDIVYYDPQAAEYLREHPNANISQYNICTFDDIVQAYKITDIKR